MILTGIAECHFWYWIDNSKKYNSAFRQLIRRWTEPILIHGLIVEWLDSVGIYISIGYRLDYDHWTLKVETLTGSDYERGYTSRQEATKQAILKANQIYNER